MPLGAALRLCSELARTCFHILTGLQTFYHPLLVLSGITTQVTSWIVSEDGDRSQCQFWQLGGLEDDLRFSSLNMRVDIHY